MVLFGSALLGRTAAEAVAVQVSHEQLPTDHSWSVGLSGDLEGLMERPCRRPLGARRSRRCQSMGAEHFPQGWQTPVTEKVGLIPGDEEDFPFPWPLD